jgi:hypothetical protein
MKATFRTALKDPRTWDRLWTGLTQVGELSNREAEIVADTARRGIADNFGHERAPNGARWAPLRPMTVAERRSGIDARGVPFRTGGEHPILQRTGDLKLSFVNPRHPRNITQVQRGPGWTGLILSAKDDPATPNRIETLHSGGTTETGNPVPPRPFIGLSTRMEEQLYKQAKNVLRGRLERV